MPIVMHACRLICIPPTRNASTATDDPSSAPETFRILDNQNQPIPGTYASTVHHLIFYRLLIHKCPNGLDILALSYLVLLVLPMSRTVVLTLAMGHRFSSQLHYPLGEGGYMIAVQYS